MARKDVARQLWMAQTAIGSLRRRRRREEMRLRGKVSYDAAGKTDEQVLEELIGPNWREIVLGERSGESASKGGSSGTGEETHPNGTDEYWEEVRRVNEVDASYAKTPIATEDDGLWQPGTVTGDRTPIATPEVWAGTGNAWQYGK